MTLNRDCIIGGVCGGLAKYLSAHFKKDIDPFFIRLTFVLLSQWLLGVYLVMWFITPEEEVE